MSATRELEWYLRDHLFRQSNAGRSSFRKELLPRDMVTLYLRYRNADLQELSQFMEPVVESLVSRKVLEHNGNELKMIGRLSRLQCVKCFYINYLADGEPRSCLRCQHPQLQDFPKKKA
ncbi:MAG TPA: hypothetical protein VNI77_00020 [Nitrososphaera sp.]|nr:hypothetical protein [Nitrososphaera sp.]